MIKLHRNFRKVLYYKISFDLGRIQKNKGVVGALFC